MVVRMPVDALPDRLVTVRRPPSVLEVREQSEMAWVDTASVVAKVVNGHPVGDLCAVVVNPCGSMTESHHGSVSTWLLPPDLRVPMRRGGVRGDEAPVLVLDVAGGRALGDAGWNDDWFLRHPRWHQISCGSGEMGRLHDSPSLVESRWWSGPGMALARLPGPFAYGDILPDLEPMF